MSRAALSILALLLASCGEEPTTEIVLIVDTDLASADELVVTASYPDGEGRSSADLATRPPPRTLVLTHRTGPLGPVRLRIAARAGGDELLAVEREVSFEAGRSLTLHVFLADACDASACTGERTCGDDGACRDPAVRPCEFEGRACEADGGVVDGADGGRPDGGFCESGGAVCGVADTLLPGDRIVPAACDGEVGTLVTVSGPSGGLPSDAGAYALIEPGAHTVRLIDRAGCAVERVVQVAGPYLVPNEGVAPGELRDLAARVGAAFVAGDSGAWAVDRRRWVDLRAAGTGPVAVANLRAVTVHEGQPLFGPRDNVGAIFRVTVDDLDGPFAHERVEIALGGGDRSVHDMAVPLFGGGTLAIATKDGLVAVDFPPMAAPLVATIGAYEASWVAVGAERAADRGEVWMGRATELANRRLAPGAAFDDGEPNAAPESVVDLRAAVVDDREPGAARLWLCGDGGVAVIRLDAHDWASLEELPAPDATWTARPCADIAVGSHGHAWVATGGNALVRLAPDASEVLVYGNAQGLAASLQIARVAVAWDDARREVWGLDAASGEVILFAADRL